jgi:hypothetical protein
MFAANWLPHAMLFGLLVDVLLLSHWLVLGQYGTTVSPAAEAGLWVVNLELQSLGIWLSVASFVIGAAGLLLLARAVSQNSTLHRWSWMTFWLAGLIILEVVAIVRDVIFSGNGMMTGIVFLLITNAAAPIWAIWLARLLGTVAAD